MIKISIITPSYNQGKFIEDTIKSVISQEGDFYLEYLIMDGGSKDETVEIIKKYEQLLKEKKWPIKCKGIEFHWVSEKDKGQTDAVNKGFRRAKGDILGWVNSDDTYNPGAISKAVEYFKKNKDIMMMYGEGYHIKDTGEIIERYYTEKFDFKRLAEVCFICQPTVFLQKTVTDKIGLLDADLHYCMDYEYWMRIGKKFKVGYISDYLANSRLYQDTKTMSKRLEVHAEILKTVKKHYGFVPNTWLLGYSDVFLEQYCSKKNFLYLKARGLLFRYKFIQFNRDAVSFSALLKRMCQSGL